MKKLIFPLLVFLTGTMQVSCYCIDIIETPQPVPAIEEVLPDVGLKEETIFNDAIPLGYDEQILLQKASKEFGVPYALALGLIEKESNFRNIVGDGGASIGYMQIQPRWHWDRMERLGVTDLSDPGGNFRVGLDLLSELYNIYGDWGMALTVYNMGHYPGYISSYATLVLESYEKWLELAGTI